MLMAVFNAELFLWVHSNQIFRKYPPFVAQQLPNFLSLAVFTHPGDPGSGAVEAADTNAPSAATQAAPPTVVSKLVRGGPNTGGSSGAQTKRSLRSTMCVSAVSVRSPGQRTTCSNAVDTRSHPGASSHEVFLFPSSFPTRCLIKVPRRWRARQRAKAHPHHLAGLFFPPVPRLRDWNQRSAAVGSSRPTSLETIRPRHSRRFGPHFCDRMPSTLCFPLGSGAWCVHTIWHPAFV